MTGRTWFRAFFPFELHHCKKMAFCLISWRDHPRFCTAALQQDLCRSPTCCWLWASPALCWHEGGRWSTGGSFSLIFIASGSLPSTINLSYSENHFVCVQMTQWMWPFCLSRNLVWHWNIVILNFASWPTNTLCHSNALFFPLILSHMYPLGGLFKVIAHLCHTTFTPFNLPSQDNVPVTSSSCFLSLNSLQFVRMNGF